LHNAPESTQRDRSAYSTPGLTVTGGGGLGGSLGLAGFAIGFVDGFTTVGFTTTAAGFGLSGGSAIVVGSGVVVGGDGAITAGFVVGAIGVGSGFVVGGDVIAVGIGVGEVEVVAGDVAGDDEVSLLFLMATNATAPIARPTSEPMSTALARLRLGSAAARIGGGLGCSASAGWATDGAGAGARGMTGPLGVAARATTGMPLTGVPIRVRWSPLSGVAELFQPSRVDRTAGLGAVFAYSPTSELSRASRVSEALWNRSSRCFSSRRPITAASFGGRPVIGGTGSHACIAISSCIELDSNGGWPVAQT
jgi:hypothetical protein